MKLVLPCGHGRAVHQVIGLATGAQEVQIPLVSTLACPECGQVFSFAITAELPQVEKPVAAKTPAKKRK